MKKHLFILLLLGVFTAVSCHKEPGPGEDNSGYGCIELCFDSRNAIGLQTRATDMEEGLEFSNVLAVLVNNSGNVVDKQYVEEGSPVSSKVVSFTGLLPGSYHVYAYANIDAAAWQQSGENLISAKESTLTADMPFSEFVDRELATLTGTDVPSDPATSMLLTGHKDVSVGLTTVTDTLDILRPVVRFKVTVRNHTPFPVQVDELRFGKFNPDRAYLLDHRDAQGVPSVPDGVTYRKLPEFNPSNPSATISASSEGIVYMTYLYENAAPESYKIFSTLTLDRSSESIPNLSLSLGKAAPLGPIEFTALSAMEDGESVNVLIVNPRKTTRAGRLFYGIGDTSIAWESFGYSSFDGFIARARAIYEENSAHEYEGFVYNGIANNQSGLAKWTGNFADAPVNETDPSTHKVVFNYTGARSTHFKKLTKQGGKYSISGLTTNPPGGTSITDLKIEAGKKISGRFPDDMNAKYLLQFVNDNSSDANYGKCLRATSAYGAATIDAAKSCPLSWDAANLNEHDHQFVLFGRYGDQFAGLKRILKDNNKEVPLAYMTRNEEINVMINVYYSDTEGQITFQVDNSTWSTPTTSSHTFN
jgi:hypothetical protein